MDPAYGSRYRELYERHWWWRARERVVEAELHRLAPPSGWARALDVGCGDGLLFPVLSVFANEVEGVEPDAALVTPGRERGGTIHVRPFDASFDPGRRYGVILFLDVLEHLDDAPAAVAHAASLLEDGGAMIVTVPAHMHLWTTHDELNHHVKRYSEPELRALLGSALRVERTRYFFRWVHGAKLVQRAVEALTRPDPAPPKVPLWPVNAAFAAASSLEEALFAWAPLPLGSSLLGVARKA